MTDGDIGVNVATALHNFFSRFDIPAYVEDNVPEYVWEDDVKVATRPPYITYQVAVPDELESFISHVRVWYKSDSAIGVLVKCSEIKNAIGNGVSIPTDGGCVVIFTGKPFMQLQTMNDPTLKVGYITIIVHSNTR